MAAFSIPVGRFHTFPDRPVVLRTADPAALPALLGAEVPAGVAFVQVQGLMQDMTPLADWGEGVPLDLVMTDPAAEFPWLYRCAGLLARHPVRVTVPFQAGLAPAVKLAVSLGFAVRLVGHQPTPVVVAEARLALDAYLHDPTCDQPVEPFHSLLLAMLEGTSVDLWSLLEEDPETLRVLDDSLSDQHPASVTDFRDSLLAAGAECRGCAWQPLCGGYFKWPGTDYPCTEVTRLFADLHAAAAELRNQLAAHDAVQG